MSTIINIIDEQVTVEVVTHPRVVGQLSAWTWGDVVSGRVTWGRVRNARYSDLINESATD